MSTAPRQRFLVYAPDKTEEGTLEKRLSVRTAHIASATARFTSGLVRVGGAILTPESTATAEGSKTMIGSAFIFEAENIEEVWKALKEDAYYTSGVWDIDKLAVHPYYIATPFNI